MGVRHLWSYVRRNEKECVEDIDFVQLAREKTNGIKIIADFYSWEHFMKAKLQVALNQKTNNPYLCVCGGEYKTLSDFITSFVETLRSLKIELVFFLDGAKGSSDLGTDQKWNTWLKRQTSDAQMIEKIITVLKGQAPFCDIARSTSDLTRPVLQEVQTILILQKLGCEIHAVVSGEADTYIARHMLKDDSVVGVFSNDTDFCIFPGCVLLSDAFFDRGNDLQMNSAAVILKNPQKLICGIIRSDTLWRHFGFSGFESLSELAIAAGNDFTLPVLEQAEVYRKTIGQIFHLAGTIRQYGNVERWPFFAHLMRLYPAIVGAVWHSRKFYSLTLPEEKDPREDSEIWRIISDGVKAARYPGSVFAMCKHFYWHRTILEDTQESGNTAERAMVYLRSHIYSIVLPKDQDIVEEYGRSPVENFENMTAWKIFYTPLPSIDTVQKSSFPKNRALFHLIMSHQEQEACDINSSYFRLYGNRLGFCCYLLRYFLLLNWGQNLFITPGEFLLLCAWVLGTHVPEDYMKMKILPRPRCITIENWLLCLFRTSHAFLGSLLNLSHEFPLPADLFSGAVWVALYSTSYLSPESQLRSKSHKQVPCDAVNINKRVRDILKERQHIIHNIVKELFPVTW